MAGSGVLIAIGSPRRNGNSAVLAEKAAVGAQAAGAKVETIILHGMDIGPCRACDACQKALRYQCVQKDDMVAVYPKLRKARGLIIASPIYWFTVSAQTKLFMDRLYAFVGPKGHGLEGKRVGILLVYGDDDPFASGAGNALRMFEDACRFTGARLVGTVHGSAGAAGEIRKEPAVLRAAYELGKEVAGR